MINIFNKECEIEFGVNLLKIYFLILIDNHSTLNMLKSRSQKAADTGQCFARVH